jgi:RNA polymerase sigma factor (sigma-70 family)
VIQADKKNHCRRDFFGIKNKKRLIEVDDRRSKEPGGEMQFHTTRWDLVLQSGDVGSPLHKESLSEFCSRYWYPLYNFARYKGFSEVDAQDLTQGFFLQLLDKLSLKHADPSRGRFRSFLLASFQNYMSTVYHRAIAAKRGGGNVLVPLDAQEANERDQLEPREHVTAETYFDAQWAQLLLERAMHQLKDEYQRLGKSQQYERLKGYLDLSGTGLAESYEEAAVDLGLSASGIKTLVFRMRRRFSALLREEVAQTIADPGDVDGEIHALYEALLLTEGRQMR